MNKLVIFIIFPFLSACFQDYNEPQKVNVKGVDIYIPSESILTMRKARYQTLNYNEALIIQRSNSVISMYVKYITESGYSEEIEDIILGGKEFYSQYYTGVNEEEKSAYLSKINFINVSNERIDLELEFFNLREVSERAFNVDLSLENDKGIWDVLFSKKKGF
ncbi:hypothetical protein [Marinomonas sp. 2405UD68-3]|uniref:hypothetical protein n=1 Tax=Marinomonas sp. 2405UD68-3 TaxID=3391835 RepID=UPI0039C917A4